MSSPDYERALAAVQVLKEETSKMPLKSMRGDYTVLDTIARALASIETVIWHHHESECRRLWREQQCSPQ